MNDSRRSGKQRLGLWLALAGLLNFVALAGPASGSAARRPTERRGAHGRVTPDSSTRPRTPLIEQAETDQKALPVNLSGRIVFSTDRDDNYEIYALGVDGGGQSRLTNNFSIDREPSVSRDGNRIAFVSNRDGNSEIYVMNADGSNQTRLTNNPADDTSPTFSPDGTRIAFVSGRTGDDEVFVMNANGSGQANLSNNSIADDGDPAWSPNGLSLAFVSDRDGNDEIYSMDATGSNQINLSNNAADDTNPAWPPARIVFQSDRDGNFEIYSMNAANGSNQIRLTNNPARDIEPATSSDGAFIVFASTRDKNFVSVADGSFELYLMRADGGAVTRLTANDDENDFEPSLQSVISPPATSTSMFSFSAPAYSVGESDGRVTITVNRTGTTTGAASVEYQTGNGTASARTDYNAASGRLTFAAGETSKSFTVFITNDVFVETDETFSVTLHSPTGATLGTPSTVNVTIVDNDAAPSSVNPIDDASFFVRQHYVDFLDREPDSAGLAFWTNQITSCGSDQSCIEARRVNVSAAFFLSIEFQQTGYVVIRAYRAAFGNIPGTPIPVRIADFLPDMQQISRGVIIGQPGAMMQLEANTVAYFNEFVTRPRFTTAYPMTLTNAQYVDMLNTNTGGALSPSERDALVNGLNNGTETRATVLRKVVEDSTFVASEFNRAFVLEQYFGYLRRDPDAAPDANFDGYNFWLNKLNQFNGDFRAAEMVRAFINSAEYRSRFGSP